MISTAPPPAGRARRARPVTPRRALVGGALVCSLLLAACGGSGELDGKVVQDGVGCTISEVDRAEKAPAVPTDVKVPKATKTTTEEKADKDACAPAADQYLTVDLVGATVDDGKVFTDTYGTDRPLTMKLGTQQLIAGLETGLTGMKVGEQRTIVIPAAEAYGKDGNPAQGIGADEDLVFVVDLISVSDSPVYCNEVTTIPKGKRDGKPTEIEMPVEAPADEVTTTVLVEGDGPEATKKSYLTVDYLGVSCASGQQFDSSWDTDDPITIAMADATPTDTAFSVIPGWTEGLQGQKQGSTVQIDIPFEDGYGAAGRPPSIGTSDPLVFIVKIIEVSDDAPPSTTTTTVAAEPTTTAAEPTTTAAGSSDSTTTTAAK
ncbi:FKBP-type peptidyl-prolyl cis-trans isomerase [Aquihabitans daechungensis]|uniref:FKBP-type peptidyl-prolyl cis-trans isomerase n=1 Tax=Aquihabitans daechungensis TaxID=1052257 RepID=UPI003BA27AA2